MIYTDKIHLVADSLEELHAFCKEVGIGRWYFEGVRKGHPHYDIPKKKRKLLLEGLIFELPDGVGVRGGFEYGGGILQVSSKTILQLSWKMCSKDMKIVTKEQFKKAPLNLLDRNALYKYWDKQKPYVPGPNVHTKDDRS